MRSRLPTLRIDAFDSVSIGTFAGSLRLRPGLGGGEVYTDDHAPVEWLVDEPLVDCAAGGRCGS